MAAFDCDVLVVGGGPTGLTLALQAAQPGASVIVCDKEADVFPLPRAAHIDHETLRIFQSIGVAKDIAATCRTTERYEFLNAAGKVLLSFSGADRIGPGGWPAANMIHQPSIERLLRRRMKEQNGAELRTRWTYLSHNETADGVTAHFATDRGEAQLRAKYLVGADGARSPVRSAGGFGLADLSFDEPWLVIDVVVHDQDRLPKSNLQICNPARPTTCVLMGEGRHRWEFMLLPGETAEEISSEASVARLLEPWDVSGAVTIERTAVYRFNARVTKEWRKGRVLIAGDAAHQMPPFAGQGMCSGIRDAANLGWKLAEVVAERASDQLLDSYQAEREPHVRATIASAIMMGRMVCTTSRWSALIRDLKFALGRALGKIPDGPAAFAAISSRAILSGSPMAGHYFPQPVAADGALFDDCVPAGAWLVGRDLPPLPRSLGAVDIADRTIEPFAGAITAWLASCEVEAALIRPDRYIFGTGSPTDLVAAWDRSLQGYAGICSESVGNQAQWDAALPDRPITMAG